MDIAGFQHGALITGLCWGTIITAVGLGLCALISPRSFERICEVGRYWIDTPLRMKKFDDYVVDTDQLAISNARLTGALFISLAIA